MSDQTQQIQADKLWFIMPLSNFSEVMQYCTYLEEAFEYKGFYLIEEKAKQEALKYKTEMINGNRVVIACLKASELQWVKSEKEEDTFSLAQHPTSVRFINLDHIEVI